MRKKIKNENVESVIGEIMVYPHDKKVLEKRINEYADLIYEMSGVKGIDYTKVRGGFNPFETEKINEKRRAEKSFLEEEILRLKKKIKRVEEILDCVEISEDKDLIIEILENKMPYQSACEIFGISSKSLIMRRIEKAVENAIKTWEENKKKATSW